MSAKRPTVLMILDGYGESDAHEHNAVYLANTPVMDELKATCPFKKGWMARWATPKSVT